MQQVSPAADLATAVAPLLVVTNVEVRYQGSMLVLKNVSLTVGEGEVVALLGSNGAGKTTTLKAISSLIQSEEGRVTEGQIHFLGAAIHNRDPVSTVRRGLVQVMEGRRVLEHMSVEQNLIVASAPIKASRQQLRRALDEIYGIFPILSEFRDRQSGYLSGGQQQMLVIGRALMAGPRLIAIDEPSLGLAPKVIDDVYATLIKLRDSRGLTLLIVEQSATRAMLTGGRMVLMRSGEVALEGDARELVKGEALRQAYFGYGDH